MTPIQQAITGKETPTGAPMTDALIQFYKAFNEGDIDLMQTNWLNSEEIAMDNPLGGIKRGWEEIESVYRRIFEGNATVYVEYYDYTIVTLEEGFCAIGRERGRVEFTEETLELAIRTSRVYKQTEDRYKQIHHHGSIDDPQQLESYQNFVK